MPIPRTPNAPYFDERGVRGFLALILQHGSNAGITNADELVSFIVRYSSDRVREVIQYIPELDDDTPNRTWTAAREQMLLLYGSSDEDRRPWEQDLVEFCREQSAKSPYRSKLEIEDYLRNFQFIAAPLLKQGDITIAQRDFYFVSGIPASIKEWFISRVPEAQRTRSNPISLTDSLGILYGYFDPDVLFPDLWNDLDSPDPPAPIPLLAETRVTHTSTLSSLPATATSIHPYIRPAMSPTLTTFPQHFSITQALVTPVRIAPFASTASSTAPLIALDTPSSPQMEPTLSHLDHDHDLREDSRADDQLKVPPSDNAYRNPRMIYEDDEESPVYFCGVHETTDHISEPHPVQDQVLSHDTKVTLDPLADIKSQINAELTPYLLGILLEHRESQMSSTRASISHDSGAIVETDADSLCDAIPSPETDIATGDPDKLRVHSFEETELSSDSALFEPDFADSSDKSQGPLTFSAEVNDELERYLAGDYSDCDEASSTYPFSDYDSGTITGSDVESIFDLVPDPETDTEVGDINELSSVALREDSGCGFELSPAVFVHDSDLLLYLARVLSDCSSPRDAELNELATASGSIIEIDTSQDSQDFEQEKCDPIGFSTEDASKPEPYTTAESKSFFSDASYVDYFVPELFDVENAESTSESVEFTDFCAPGDDPPSYQPSTAASKSSFPFTQPQIRAEYLYFIVSWIFGCLNLLAQGLFRVLSILPVFIQDEPDLEPHPEQDLRLIQSCEPFNDALDVRRQDCVGLLAEPVPPDKSLFTQNSDTFKEPYDSTLTSSLLQSFKDRFRREANELSHALDRTESHSDNQNDRKSYIFFEPSTELLSNHEPFKRAEPQSFSSCASYTDYFEADSFESNSQSIPQVDQSPERTPSAASPEPEDDPPSYQESISSSKSSFGHAHPHTRAKCLINILLWMFACWQFCSRYIFRVTLQFQGYIGENSNSEAQRDSDEVESIELCEDTHSAPDFSDQDGVEIRAEPIPPDKSSIHLISDPFIFTQYTSDSPLNDIPLQYFISDTSAHFGVDVCSEPVPPHKSVISFDSDHSVFSEY
ncbi:hypothetical protein B0H13DRAFT_1900445 [Mycena leptocephala]|nr:hypothetical protein B0H13DRAFT_1900445 [Mycena leptocephala]